MCVTIVCRVDNRASQDNVALGPSVCLGSHIPMAINSKSCVIFQILETGPKPSICTASITLHRCFLCRSYFLFWLDMPTCPG